MKKLSWLPEHAKQLKSLRLAAGVEISTLAKRHSLSSAQVLQLEEGGDSSFYSPEIKYTVGRKLIRSFGEEITAFAEMDDLFASPTLERVPPVVPAVVSQTPSLTRSEPIFKKHKRRWMPVLLILLLGVMAWYGISGISNPQQTPEVKALTQTSMMQEPKPEQPQPPIQQTTATTVTQPNDHLKAQPHACDWSGQSIDLTPPSGSRPGHYIYIVSAQPAVVCWKDSAQNQRKITLMATESITLEGKPPFHLFSTDLNRIKVYYLGNLIRMPSTDIQYVLLGRN